MTENSLGDPANHNHGWSWVGTCAGAYILGKEHPEIQKIQPKGAMYPGSMGHLFYQKYVLPGGMIVEYKDLKFEILDHEQQLFIPMKYAPFRMSPIDTLVWDLNRNGFGIIDYKTAKDFKYVKEDAKEANRLQVNLYAYARKALWYMIIYIDKISYDHTICHIYETDPDLAKKAIQVLQKVDYWTAGHRENLVWTDIATGLNVITKYYKPYRYICEPSQSTPYTGCPYKKYCLENLSKQHNQTFTSLVRYDQYLKNKEN